MFRIGLFLRSFEWIALNAAWQIFAVMLAHQLFFVIDLWLAWKSPPDAMRSLRRRLAGVAVIGLYLLMWYQWIPSEYAHNLYSGAPGLAPPNQASKWILSRLIPATLLIVSLQAILEKPIEETSGSPAALKRRWWNRRLFRVLDPGWPSGVIFAFILAAAVAALLVWRDYGIWKVYQLKNQSPVPLERTHLLILERYSPSHWAAMSAWLVSPLVLWLCLLRKWMSWNALVYSFLFLGMVVLQMLLLVVVRFSGNQSLAKLILPFPGMYWLWSEFQQARAVGRFGEMMVSRVDWSGKQIMILTGVVWLFWWSIALVFALRFMYASAGFELHREKMKPTMD